MTISQKQLALLLLSYCLISCGQDSDKIVNKQHPELPNILLFNIDDLGWKDTEPYQTDFYQTPHINSLADMGMTFTNAYAGASNCAPSRACLMSGQNTPRHGIYTVSNSDRGNIKSRKIVPIENTQILEDSIISIAEMLGEAGYTSASFGKWHLSEDSKDQGFTLNVGGDKRGNPGKNGHFAPYNLKDPLLQDAPEGENLTDRLTTEALDFMAGVQDDPFFVYMSYYAVHTPIQTTPALENKYKSLGNELQNNAKYAGMVETVDTNIGRILQYLTDSKQLNNTLIIFTSDNGGIRDISSQHPLRAGKGSYYEGGIRVPLIFVWKDKIHAGSHSDQTVSQLDLYPTLREITESSLANRILDGQSLLPILTGQTIQERDLHFHFPIYLQAYNQDTDDGRDPFFRTRPGSVIISGEWKLHLYYEDNGLELYNLQTDQGERHNLRDKHPEKARELLDKMKSWQSTVHAPVPDQLNPDYDPSFKPEKINR